MFANRFMKNNFVKIFSRNVHENTLGGKGQTSAPKSSAQVNNEVPGLSSAVVNPASQPVGPNVDPNKSGAYKAPEYFCYHNMSYFEAEIEMSKFRVPQPSALRK